MHCCADGAVFGESSVTVRTRVSKGAAGCRDADPHADGREQGCAAERAERYRSILDSQTELVCRWLANGRIVFANEAYCRFFGRTADDVLGSRWRPERGGPGPGSSDDDVVLAQLARLSAEHPLACLERRVRAAGGGFVWLRYIFRGIFDADGALAEIQSVAHDIDDQKRVEDALHEAQELLEFRVAERTRELRQLAAQITVSEERERRMIADDLHDDLGQILHVMTLKIEGLKSDGGAALSPVLAEVNELTELDELVARASRHVRSLTSQLGSRILDEFGLSNALRWLCDEMARVYGLRVAAQIDPLPQQIPLAVGSVLFRGIRELLINVTRHADTDAASLVVRSNGSLIQVIVEDSGRGGRSVRGGRRNLAGGGRGYGLSSLRERLLVLGGVLRIDGERRPGFRVEFLVPTRDPHAVDNDGVSACRSE